MVRGPWRRIFVRIFLPPPDVVCAGKTAGERFGLDSAVAVMVHERNMARARQGRRPGTVMKGESGNAMNCEEAYARIQDFIDGRLDSDGAVALRSHSARCPRCRDEMRAFEGLARMLHKMERCAPPSGFADGVVARLEAAGIIAGPGPAFSRRRAWIGAAPWYRVPLALGVMALAALSLFPATIRPLTALAGKGAMVVTDAFFVAQQRLSELGVLRRIAAELEHNLRPLGTVVHAGLSLLATAGEIFMLPAVAALVVIALGLAWFFRSGHGRGGEHASFSF